MWTIQDRLNKSRTLIVSDARQGRTHFKWRAAVLIVPFVIAGCSGCVENANTKTIENLAGQHRLRSSPLVRSVPEETEQTGVDVDFAAQKWRVVIGVGDYRDGFETVEFSDEGTFTHTWWKRNEGRQQWLQRQARCPDAELANMLNDLNLFKLCRVYQSDLADGTLVFVRIRVGQQEKTILCDNHFPDEIVKLHDYIWNVSIRNHCMMNAESTSIRDYKPSLFQQPVTE